MTVRVTDALLSLLDDRRIYCHEQKKGSPRRWKVEDRLTFRKDANFEPYVTFRTGNRLTPLGAFSYTNSEFPMNIQIGRYCSIAGGVEIAGWNHPVAAVTTSPIACIPDVRWVQQAKADFNVENFHYVEAPQKPLPVIGNDVWIGKNVSLARGITIGDGAVLAGGANVTRNVAPYAIVGGNKADFIRWRFEDEGLRQSLVESQWWRYDPGQVMTLDFADPMAFIKGFDAMEPDLSLWSPKTTNLYEQVKALT